MTVPQAMIVSGVPSGPRPRGGSSPTWRAQVAEAAAAHPTAAALRATDGLDLAFVLRPRQFIDLDTLVETALAGLRDAGVRARGFPRLDALVATKADADADAGPGLTVRSAEAAALRARPLPGPDALGVTGALPGTGRPAKVAWRDAIASAWGGRPLLEGAVWADVRLAVTGSLLGPLEPILDALEPVLGRDPRGRDWQEFFPADDRIMVLRVHRGPSGAPPVRLRLGPVVDGEE